ncbi:hypothetical protein ACIQAL_05260 [Pseudomonas sp. NPDC088368]|jgi:hypothetical protein|uniref:hypothetical protein n=1 Tax=Pseudomonas sp. NPDC088368 TaxID=3364453 RepID=UPI0038137891
MGDSLDDNGGLKGIATSRRMTGPRPIPGIILESQVHGPGAIESRVHIAKA